MAIKYNGTEPSYITVKENSTSTEIKAVVVRQKSTGIEKQVWGERDFQLDLIGASNLNTVKYSYNDAGTRAKTVTPTITAYNNKIYIDKKHFTLENILSFIRYANTTDAGWIRTNTSSSTITMNGDQLCTIYASAEPQEHSFPATGVGITIRATYGHTGTSSYGQDLRDNWNFWEIVYFDKRDSSNLKFNYIWTNSIDPITYDGNQYYPYGYTYFNGNWDSSTGFISSKPESFSDAIEITDDYIIITLPQTISYTDKYMSFYAGKFMGLMSSADSVDNVGFDQSVTGQGGTAKTQTYEYTYDNPIPVAVYNSSKKQDVICGRKFVNTYSFTPTLTSDVRSALRSSSTSTEGLYSNSDGVEYGTSVYIRPIAADGYFPEGVEGVDYFSYTGTGGATFYYIWLGPYIYNESNFSLTKPSSIKTNGSSSKTIGPCFTRITWSITINVDTTTLTSIDYTRSDTGATVTLTGNATISNLDYGTTITINNPVAIDGETTTTKWTFSGTGTYSCPTGTGTTRSLTVNTKATRRSYTIKFTNGTYGTWSSTANLTAYYGDTISVSNNVLSINKWNDGTQRSSRTYNLTADTAQYHYSNILNFTSPITDTQTITSTDTREIRTYTILWTNWNGEDLETDYDVEYGSTPSYDSATPTRESTDQYTYTFTGWNPTVVTVTEDAEYIAQFSSTTKKYPVTITAGTGVSSVYLSTSSTATSGSASGTEYDYGTTVYGFIEIADGYYVNNPNYTLVSGTEYEAGAIYRIGSVEVDSAEDFGLRTATRNPYIYLGSLSNGSATIDGTSKTGGSYTYVKYGSSHTVVFSANTNYYVGYESSGTGSDSITVNGSQTRYRTRTITLSSVTSNQSLSPSFTRYYTWSFQLEGFPLTGSITYNATSSTVNVSTTSNYTFNYTGSVTTNLVIHSIEVYGTTGTKSNYGYLYLSDGSSVYPYAYNNSDDKVITSVTGDSPSSNRYLRTSSGGASWLGNANTVYHDLTYAFTNSSTNKSVNVSGYSDSASAYITSNNWASSITLANTTSGKSISTSSSRLVLMEYLVKDNNTITCNTSGGTVFPTTFSAGDSSSSPITIIVTIEVARYRTVFLRSENYTGLGVRYQGSSGWTTTSVSNGSTSSISVKVGSTIEMVAWSTRTYYNASTGYIYPSGCSGEVYQALHNYGYSYDTINLSYSSKTTYTITDNSYNIFKSVATSTTRRQFTLYSGVVINENSSPSISVLESYQLSSFDGGLIYTNKGNMAIPSGKGTQNAYGVYVGDRSLHVYLSTNGYGFVNVIRFNSEPDDDDNYESYTISNNSSIYLG